MWLKSCIYFKTHWIFSLCSDTFQKVQDNSEKVWRYHRFSLVYEYYERPALFPPFIILNHMFRAVRWMINKCGNCCGDSLRSRNSFSKSLVNGCIDRNWILKFCLPFFMILWFTIVCIAGNLSLRSVCQRSATHHILIWCVFRQI